MRDLDEFVPRLVTHLATTERLAGMGFVEAKDAGLNPLRLALAKKWDEKWARKGC